MNDYLSILESYHDDMLKTLKESVSFPSVLAPSVKSADGELMPFGRNIHDAYCHMMNLGRELGFNTVNADNYGGHIEFRAGEDIVDPETFAVVGHLDVVPAGDGWTTADPFIMEEKDGYVYGRGVSDDKGPLIASLYAMKAIKEAGIVPKMNIRLILGLDEETEKNGMKYYLDEVGQPDMGFTPDGDFPLINGEMGILFFSLAQKFSRQSAKDGLRLTRMEAGTAPNAVPAGCKAVLAGDQEIYAIIKDRLAQYNVETGHTIKAKKQGSSLVLEASGIAAHGAHPHLGLNAISVMMDFLGRLQFSNEELNDYIAYYNEYIGFDLHGERLGCELEDEPSGKLILNVGMASINEEIAELTINIRYPVSCTDDQVYSAIEEALKDSSIGIVKIMHEGPIYLDINDPMVDKMLEAYAAETGDHENKPMVIGGGTYAKMINHTLAFGALFPNEDDTMHQADEKLSITSFYKMARIYARTIYSLCCE